MAVGAITTYVVSARGERNRFRRDLALRWEERKLDAYFQYVSDVKTVHKIARQLAAARGLHDRDTPLEPDVGLSMLADAVTRRSISSEQATFLADEDTLTALRRLNDAVRTLVWYARGKVPNADKLGWDRAFATFMDALDHFQACARAEIHVPGQRRVEPRSYPRPDKIAELG